MTVSQSETGVHEGTSSSRVPGRIVYSQCWEDPESGRNALGITPDDDVLMITSGGCNVLAFSLEQPRSITAIDSNSAQNHLLELKIAAIRGLDYDSFLRFLGVRQSNERRDLYQAVRQHLSAAAQEYWDAQRENIERGVIHTGRFDRYLNLFRQKVLPLIHSRKQVQRLLSLKDVEEQKYFYERVWDNWRWRALFRIFFSRYLMGRLGRYPEFFRYVDIRDVGYHYLKRARHALTEIPIRDNYFLEYILTGGFRDSERMPPYLIESNFGALKASVERIRIFSGTLESFLATTADGSVSKFYLSDIFELVPMDHFERVLHQIVRVSRDGARLCYYNNLVSRGHPASLDKVIESEDELGKQLHWRDRSFVYRRFVVERVRK
ncbi:MAG: BtaA family protein [Acidobacteriota bacterium]